MTSTPVPMTATVTPPAFSAPRCAAPSMPRARPLTTMTPALASSSPSCPATASPYGEGRREQTMATRGPWGGGQRPLVRSKGSRAGILQPEAKRLEHVVLLYLVRRIEVGGCEGDAPGAVVAPRGHSPVGGPALESPSGRRCECRKLAESGGLELRVETALTGELPLASADHPRANGP